MRFTGISKGGRLAACLLLFGLVGCVSVPKTELEASSAGRIRSIALLKVSEPQAATVMNMGGAAGAFGLVGGLVQAGVDSSHSKAYTQLLADRRFSFSQPIADAITRSLRSSGYAVTYLSDQGPKLASDGKSDDFSDVHTDADAILVVWYTVVGYVSPPNMTKYEPWIGVRARLMDAKTKRDLYFKTFSGGYKNIAKNVINLPADTQYQYPGFDDLTRNADTSVAGMMASIDTIAAYIGHDFAQASPLAGRDLANTVPAMSATTPAPAPVAVPASIPAVLPITAASVSATPASLVATPTTTAPVAATSPLADDGLVTLRQPASLRSQPQSRAAVTAVLPAGQRVKLDPHALSNASGDWNYIESGSDRGWTPALATTP